MRKIFTLIIIINSIVLISEIKAQGWFSQTSGTKAILTGVCFIDVNTGFIAGKFGTLLKTTNGGDVWEKLDYSAKDSLESLVFVDANTGFVVGISTSCEGIILRTTDAGTTWDKYISGANDKLVSMHFIGPQKGYVVGTDPLKKRVSS